MPPAAVRYRREIDARCSGPFPIRPRKPWIATSAAPRRSLSMRTMSDFDPDRPSRVHDRINDRTMTWHTAGAAEWREYARPMPDGTVHFDGYILDGWEPVDGPGR
jgi:hypothetical protein